MSSDLAAWERSGLKAITRHAIDLLGGYDVAELVAGRSRSTLHGYTNVHTGEFAPLDIVLRLDRAARDLGHRPLITALIASRLDQLLLPVPAGEGDACRHAAQVFRKAGGLAASHAEAMADGTLSAAEQASLAAEVDELIAAATRLRAALAPPAAGRVAIPTRIA